MIVRPAAAADLKAIGRIQQASPESARWPAIDYLAHRCTVAVEEDRVVGFLVIRAVAAGEHEVLNTAVDPAWRRRGVARRLLQEVVLQNPGRFFLEVRESNLAACRLYEQLGFQIAGRRAGYYESPSETAIVMTLQSC